MLSANARSIEISGYIYDRQFDSYVMLEQLLRCESRLMMMLALAIQEDIQGRNQRFLIDSLDTKI